MSDEEKARRILFLHISDEMTDPAARRSVLRIAQALAEARAEERARSAKLVEVLEHIVMHYKHSMHDTNWAYYVKEIALLELATYRAEDGK